MEYIDENDAYIRYDDMLDELYGVVRFDSQLSWDASQVLKEMDEIAYHTGFNDWLDSEGLTTDESEADGLGGLADDYYEVNE